MKLKMIVGTKEDHWADYLTKEFADRGAHTTKLGTKVIAEDTGTMEHLFEVMAIGMHFDDYEIHMTKGGG